MRKGRKTKASSARKVSAEQFAAIALVVVPAHQHLIADGWQLKPSSRIWKRKDGSWAGRFLYRKPEASAVSVSIEHCVEWVETA